MHELKAQIKGHVLVKDKNSGECLLDKMNAVHSKNMAVTIARGLSGQLPDSTTGLRTSQIFKIKLGNGGSNVDSLGIITFNSPNVTGTNADLYSPTYSEILDESQASTPAENSVTFQESPDANSTSTIVICTATIAADEPLGQDVTDTELNASINSAYAFDELGLFTSDGLLLTHIVFSPILKTANRELVITYTLTITVS